MANTFNAITTGTGGIKTTGDSSGAFSFTKDGGSAEVYIDASGNVGIGTSSPDSKLTVQAPNATGSLALRSIKNSGGNTRITEVYDADNVKWSIGTRSSVPLITVNEPTGEFSFNSGYGSAAVAYGCRAWVNFNGTGTVAIRASGNVSSITDNGTGDYTVNFTTAMPDANYATTGTAGNPSGQQSGQAVQPISDAYNTGSVRVGIGNSSAFLDRAVVSVAVFR